MPAAFALGTFRGNFIFYFRNNGQPAGNQNCGKTTLFNQLTGSNQHVGNFPGVTVDRKSGAIKGCSRCRCAHNAHGGQCT